MKRHFSQLYSAFFSKYLSSFVIISKVVKYFFYTFFKNRRKKQSSHPVFTKKGGDSIMLANRVFTNSCRQNHPTFHFWTFIFVHFQNPKHFTNIEIHRKRKICWFLPLFGIMKSNKTLYPIKTPYFFLSSFTFLEMKRREKNKTTTIKRQ